MRSTARRALTHLANWSYLTGFGRRARAGLELLRDPRRAPSANGAMIAHSDLAFVIDAQGRERDALIDDPGPTQAFRVVVLLSPARAGSNESCIREVPRPGRERSDACSLRRRPWSIADRRFWHWLLSAPAQPRRVDTHGERRLDAERFRGSCCPWGTSPTRTTRSGSCSCRPGLLALVLVTPPGCGRQRRPRCAACRRRRRGRRVPSQLLRFSPLAASTDGGTDLGPWLPSRCAGPPAGRPRRTPRVTRGRIAVLPDRPCSAPPPASRPGHRCSSASPLGPRLAGLRRERTRRAPRPPERVRWSPRHAAVAARRPVHDDGRRLERVGTQLGGALAERPPPCCGCSRPARRRRRSRSRPSDGRRALVALVAARPGAVDGGGSPDPWPPGRPCRPAPSGTGRRVAVSSSAASRRVPAR